jgi:hypothetical protein
MTDRKEFHPLQAQEIARAFNDNGVDYLFIGKSGAILLGKHMLPNSALPRTLLLTIRQARRSGLSCCGIN